MGNNQISIFLGFIMNKKQLVVTDVQCQARDTKKVAWLDGRVWYFDL
jgi:hypothetical protein